MAVALKARISNKWHSARIRAGGTAVEVVVVQAIVETDEPSPRSFGPFQKEFPAGTAQYEIDQWVESERAALDGRI